MFVNTEIPRRALTAVVAFITCSIVINCGGAPGYIGTMRSAYLPYVYDIAFIGESREGEPVMVSAKLSTQLKPEVLQGLSAWPNMASPSGSWIPAWKISGQEANTVFLQPWISEPLMTGSPVDEYVFNLGMFKSGIYRLVVQTAESQEWGGLSADYNSGAPNQETPTHPHAVFREYTFTVLRAEE